MTLKKHEVRKVSGKDALLMQYDGNHDGRPLRFLALAVFTEERVYLITCSATPEQFALNDAEFRKAVESFALMDK